MKPHYLRCLGQPALFGPNGEPIRIRTKKHLALLVYLAVEQGRGHRRDELAALLWPKHDVNEARHSLSTALSMFRAMLGRDAIDASREKIALKPNRLVLDLDQLLNGEVTDNGSTSPLNVAGFLDGFDIADAAEFAHWKDRQQARLLPAVKQALISLTDRLRHSGEFQQIEEIADRMLAIDDLSEEAIRAKMEARAMAGDRITALKIYEHWRARLARDLQATPSELLQQMAEQLRTAKWRPVIGANATERSKELHQSASFVGRTAEYRILYDGWKQLTTITRTHLLIVGESGVGKTTLAQRLATVAALEGAITSRVQCYDIESEIPYSLASTLVMDLLHHPAALGTAPEALAELAKIAPEIRKRFPTIPISTDTQGEAARIRLTEALLELLTAMAEERPVLVIVDDFHFADDASIAVLHLTMRRMKNLSVSAMFITRPEELRRALSATRLLDNIETLGLRKIELLPLTLGESERLLDLLVFDKKRQPTRLVRRLLLKAAAGYPMLLELLVQDWQTHGDESLALSLNAMTKHLPGENTGAAMYKNILQRVIPSLQSTTQKALNLAAILGHRLNDLDMYALVKLNPENALNALSELETIHLLRDNNYSLEFRNELIRSASYLAVPSSVRTMLHRQIANHLIAAPRHSRASSDLEIAWHCVRGGMEKKATLHLLNGTRDALNQGATEQAEHALATALPYLEGHDHEAALLLLVEALQNQSRWTESLAWLDKYPSETSSDLRTILAMHANHFLNSRSAEQIGSAIERLIGIATVSPATQTRIKAVRVASRFLPDLRDKTAALALLECIDSLLTDGASDRELIELSLARALCLYHAHRREATLATLSTSADRYRATGTINSTLWSLIMGLGAIKGHQGKYEEALVEFEHAYEVATRIGSDASENDSAAQIALCLCRLGRYETALEWTKMIKTKDHFSGYVEIQRAYYSAFAHAFRRDTEHAVITITDLDARLPDSSPSWLIQTWRLLKADILHLVGQHSNAANIANEAIGYPTPILYSRFFAGPFARWLALTADSPTKRQTASSLVTELTNTISDLDMMDQAEVTCAAHLIIQDTTNDGEPQNRHTALQNVLNQLPQAVEYQLQALGVLYP